MPSPTPWTTHDQLTPDQRERYGDYVLSKDEVRARSAASFERDRRVDAAMAEACGDTPKALGLMLNGSPAPAAKARRVA